MTVNERCILMKKAAGIILLALTLCLLAGCAFGESYTRYANVWAVSNRRLATRTGPGTEYDEPGSFNEAGVSYRILSKAFDSRNGIWWVQVEISAGGGIYWAYTGVKRFENLNLDAVPEEKVIGRCTTSFSLTGLYAPVPGGVVISRSIPAGVDGDIYGYVYQDDSDYILIQFYDASQGCTRRAWVSDTMVDDYEMYYGF